MKRIKFLFITLIILLTPILVLAGCGKEPLGANYKAGTPTSYITLNYNPGVELVADDKHKVIAVNALNDDAELFFFQKDYRGYDIDVVFREMVKAMAQTGYLVADSEESADAVFVSVYSTSTEIKNLVQAKIKATTEAFFETNGLYAAVAETPFDNKITTEASKNGVSSNTERFRAILKVMEYDADIELKTAKDMSATKLLKKLYDEVLNISQIKTKAQKDTYLNARATLKQTYESDLVAVYNNSAYTQLYNELKSLEEEYRTTDDITYANNTLKPAILSKIEQMQTMEPQIKSTASTAAINLLKAQYNANIENLLLLNVQLSQENMPNYVELLLQRKTEFLISFQTRQNYVKYNSYLWSEEYANWKPNTTTKMAEFLSTISTRVTSVRTSTRTDVNRALNRINPYTKTYGFGDSSGGTWTFP